MKRIILTTAATILFVLLGFTQTASAAVTLADGGFEGGAPSLYWADSSTLGYTIITGSNARTGTYKAFLGGANGAGEVATIEQTIKMPKKGKVALSFWLRVPLYDPAGSDKLQVYVDGSKLLTIKETSGAAYSSYQQVLVDLSAFLDGGTHTLTFKGTDKSGANTAWYIDDVSLILEAFKNTSFEDDSNGDNVPDGWKISSPSGQTRRVCDEAWTGSCSVRLRGTGGAEQLIYIWKPGLTGKAGDAFQYYACVKAEAIPGGNSIRVIATQTNGVDAVVYQLPIGGGTFAWGCDNTAWIVPFDYKKLRVVVEYTAATGTMWWDDVSLTQIGGPVPAPAAGGALFGE